VKEKFSGDVFSEGHTTLSGKHSTIIKNLREENPSPIILSRKNDYNSGSARSGFLAC
jgi:hypothetical protein